MTRTQQKRWEEAKATAQLLERQLLQAAGKTDHDKSGVCRVMAERANRIGCQMLMIEMGMQRFVADNK